MVLNRARLGFVPLFTLISLTVPLTSFAQTAAGSTALTTSSSTTALDLTTPATINIASSTSPSNSSGQATSTPALDPHNSVDVASAVKSYFADIPVMAAIAKCESSFTQYNTNGTVLNGGSGGMIGVFQINKSVHAKFALTLGDDITTLQGNMAYARYLYDGEGTDPWISSEGCWGPVVSAGLLPAAASSTMQRIIAAVTPSVAHASTLDSTSASSAPAKASTAGALSINLKSGSVSSQVATLQQLLNTAGYMVAKSGAGSPGQETSTFGPATKSAVQRFQCTHNIACSGSESTTGYGYVGAKTRAALSNALALAR
jgi:hypothetical protein